MEYLSYAFYLIGIIPILHELTTLTNLNLIFRLKKEIKLKTGQFQLDHFLFILVNSFYTIWVLIGLFTVNWPAFLFIVIISLIPKRNKIILWVDALISFGVLIFISLNAFHFKINLYDFIINFFYYKITF